MRCIWIHLFFTQLISYDSHRTHSHYIPPNHQLSDHLDVNVIEIFIIFYVHPIPFPSLTPTPFIISLYHPSPANLSFHTQIVPVPHSTPLIHSLTQPLLYLLTNHTTTIRLLSLLIKHLTLSTQIITLLHQTIQFHTTFQYGINSFM